MWWTLLHLSHRPGAFTAESTTGHGTKIPEIYNQTGNQPQIPVSIPNNRAVPSSPHLGSAVLISFLQIPDTWVGAQPLLTAASCSSF